MSPESDRRPDATPPKPLPVDVLPLLAVRGTVLSPGMIIPLAVGRPRSVAAVEAAMLDDRLLGVVCQKDPRTDDPGPDDLHPIGTSARILRAVEAPDGHRVIVQGVARVRVTEVVETDPFLAARFEEVKSAPVPEEAASELEGHVVHLRTLVGEVIELMPEPPPGVTELLAATSDPDVLVDALLGFLDATPDEKQEILAETDPRARLRMTSERLAHQIEVMKVTRKLRESAQGSMEKAQREYVLREQLNAIKKELGEDAPSELTELKEALASADLPDEVRTEAERELSRLEAMPPSSMESGTIRSWLEWIIELPWRRSSPADIDLERARAVLDEDHHGLEKVKRRILEFLAVRKLRPGGKSPILCFVGPPGVGKTSLGRSIARATGRTYARVSLGGVHDEAEIRGHRRTYVGALPGNILDALRRAGTNNPVFVLDEIDKLTASAHGNPSAALLEVLDPEQNRTFRDHYLNLPFDLSDVFFVATANVVDAIPGPLRDRCETIELSGYTEEEKLRIARTYLEPRQIEESGLTRDAIEITERALVEVIRHYTREAGCRNLERLIGSLARHVAVRVAQGSTVRATVDADDVHEILGPRKFESELAQRTSLPGVATGLAWTPAGGELLFVEAARSPGRGKLILTGQLGDVMRESAQAALTLVKSHADELEIDPAALAESDLHLHVPAGAIPKDGPSAGVTMYAALVSLLTRRNVRPDVAMTGEISLRGLVLPVGGVKEKALAAHRAGIRTVILPEGNVKDLDEVPAAAKERLKFVPISDVCGLEAAFVAPAGRRPAGDGSPRTGSASR